MGFFVCGKLSNTKSKARRTMESITMHELTLKNPPPFHQVADPISVFSFFPSLLGCLRKWLLNFPLKLKQWELWISSQAKKTTPSFSPPPHSDTKGGGTPRQGRLARPALRSPNKGSTISPFPQINEVALPVSTVYSRSWHSWMLGWVAQVTG